MDSAIWNGVYDKEYFIMLSLFILSSSIFALGIMLYPSRVKSLSLLSSLISIVLFYCITLKMNFSSSNIQLSESMVWVKSLGINLHIGMDLLSWVFCALTLFIHLIITVSSVMQDHERLKGYMALFLVMQSMTLGVFTAYDAILFYIFWEGMLIPMYLCICGYGSEDSMHAAMKFFLFTFVGSLLMLFGFIYLGIISGSFSFIDWVSLPLSFNQQWILFLLLLPGFAVKVPMFPLHTWLPKAHTEAPSEGSVVLAGLMLKVGAYGFIRILMPILPDACRYFSTALVILSLIAIIYVGIVAYSQRDIKQLIAYSSVSHMGFVTLGLFMIYHTKFEIALMAFMGAIIQMITHAFGSGALFLSFGMLYAKVKKRNIETFKGLYTQLPWFSLFFMLFVFSTIGVPATAGFVGEWMVITSTIMTDIKVGLLAVLGVVISAAYLLNLVKEIFFGKPSLAVEPISDIDYKQGSLLALFSLAIIGIGVYPMILIKILTPSVNTLVKLSMLSKTGGI